MVQPNPPFSVLLFHLPDGPKVGSVAVSPRGDLRMPSDASSAVWMKELDEIKEENGF